MRTDSIYKIELKDLKGAFSRASNEKFAKFINNHGRNYPKKHYLTTSYLFGYITTLLEKSSVRHFHDVGFM